MLCPQLWQYKYGLEVRACTYSTSNAAAAVQYHYPTLYTILKGIGSGNPEPGGQNLPGSRANVYVYRGDKQGANWPCTT